MKLRLTLLLEHLGHGDERAGANGVDHGGGDAVILALLDEAAVRDRVDRGKQRGAGLLGIALGLAKAGGGDGEIGRSGQRFLDEGIELRVAIGLPPGIGRPGGGVRRGEALRRGIALGRADRGGCSEVRNMGASGHHRGAGQQGGQPANAGECHV